MDAEGLQWWQGFWGWAITTGLAALAAVGVIAQEVRHRRARPFAELSIDRFGKGEWDGKTLSAFALTNAGVTAATMLRLVPKNAVQAFPNGDEYRVPSVLPPNAEQKFLIEGTDLAESYVVLIWNHNPTKRQVLVRWLPLAEEGPLREELDRQLAEQRSWPGRLMPRLPGKPQLVGPGGAPAVRIRKQVEERVRAALADPVAAPAEP